MTEAQKILKMIESVKPDYTDTLDEIDARTECFFQKNVRYVNHFTDEELGRFCVTARQVEASIEYDAAHEHIWDIPHYTRSRDALKSIRPEGWNLDITSANQNYPYSKAKIYISAGFRDKEAFYSPELPTEELAELHAIIQAIQYERTTNDTPTDNQQ